jgi:hypothetical protein
VDRPSPDRDGSADLAEQLRLQADEELRLAAETEEAVIAVTDRRLIAKQAERFALDVPLEDIRRIQLDVERARPASFVVVPLDPQREPQVLSIPVERLEAITRMTYIIGERLDALG